jgi:hypothetical protein
LVPNANTAMQKKWKAWFHYIAGWSNRRGSQAAQRRNSTRHSPVLKEATQTIRLETVAISTRLFFSDPLLDEALYNYYTACWLSILFRSEQTAHPNCQKHARGCRETVGNTPKLSMLSTWIQWAGGRHVRLTNNQKRPHAMHRRAVPSKGRTENERWPSGWRRHISTGNRQVSAGRGDPSGHLVPSLSAPAWKPHLPACLGLQQMDKKEVKQDDLDSGNANWQWKIDTSMPLFRGEWWSRAGGSVPVIVVFSTSSFRDQKEKLKTGLPSVVNRTRHRCTLCSTWRHASCRGRIRKPKGELSSADFADLEIDLFG